jgi:hypothetical protein
MYLLKRSISPYTSHDALLGCFHSHEKAQAARDEYLEAHRANPSGDRWKEQAYRSVDLEKDVVIVDNIPEVQVQPTQEEVFILSSFAEGFGQIIRTFRAICASFELAEKKSKEIEEQLDDEANEYCQIQKVVVDKLLPDEEI